MLNRFSLQTAAGAVLSMSYLGVAPVQAFQLVTFVSGKGADGGTCASPASPCRSFQFAIGQTTPGGEVKALDPAHYGGMVIIKSISITGVEGASIDRVSGNAITINAGPNDKINLSHLTIDGINVANNGIVLNSGGSLTITHCVVRNFVGDGIRLAPTGVTTFLIDDAIVTDNNGVGIDILSSGAGSAQGTVGHVLMTRNKDGLHILAPPGTGTAVTVVESSATNNKDAGFAADGGGVLGLAHSAAKGNGTGVFVAAGAKARSSGDNYISGNGTDVDGTLTFVGLGNAAAGKMVYEFKCRVCHQIGDGARNFVGPQLNGLIGRKAGSVADYNYSDAMKNSGLTWDEANLKEFLFNPKAKVPGTKMIFAGVPKERDLVNLIAYLTLFGPDGKEK